MAIEERFTAIISARNEAGATLRRIGAQFAELSRRTGMTRIAAATVGAGRAFGTLANQVGSVAAPMAAVAGAAAGVGIVTLARSAAAAGDDFGDLAEKTGASVRDLQAWGDAAQRAGASPEDLANSLGRLNNNIRDAATGGNNDLADLFRRLRISMRDADGNIRSAADVLPQLADGFMRNEDPTRRTAMAMALFGRAGTALIPMLAAGSQELREQGERWRKYGFDFTSVLDGMKDAQAQFDNMDAAVKGLGHAIGAQLAPILGPIAQRMADWISANRRFMAMRIGAFVEGLAARFGQFFAERGPLTRLEDFIAIIGRVVDRLGGFQNVLIGFGALAAAPFVAAVVGIGAAFVPVVAALGKLALALGAGSPVGLAILAFAGLAAVVIKYWEPLKAFFQGLWANITAIFNQAWEAIRPVVNAVTAAVAPLRAGNSPTGPVASPAAQALRLANGSAGGARRIDENNLSALAFPPLPSILPNPAQAAANLAGAGQQNKVEVEVNVNNLPPGSRVDATSEGALLQQPRTSVGFALRRAPR